MLKELVESGKVTPVIDRTYPLSEAPEAIRLPRARARPRQGRHHRLEGRGQQISPPGQTRAPEHRDALASSGRADYLQSEKEGAVSRHEPVHAEGPVGQGLGPL